MRNSKRHQKIKLNLSTISLEELVEQYNEEKSFEEAEMHFPLWEHDYFLLGLYQSRYYDEVAIDISIAEKSFAELYKIAVDHEDYNEDDLKEIHYMCGELNKIKNSGREFNKINFPLQAGKVNKYIQIPYCS